MVRYSSPPSSQASIATNGNLEQAPFHHKPEHRITKNPEPHICNGVGGGRERGGGGGALHTIGCDGGLADWEGRVTYLKETRVTHLYGVGGGCLQHCGIIYNVNR
jgi:hypothetical protein